MKAGSIGKANSGMATLEILIAFAVLILCIGGVILLAFGNQSVALDSETNNEALYKAEERLEDAKALAKRDFDISSDLVPTVEDIYSIKLKIDPFEATECSKLLESEVIWQTEALRPQQINLFSRVVDLDIARAMGGDCPTLPPSGGALEKSGKKLNDGGRKTNGLDVYNKIAYIALQGSPGLRFVNAINFDNPFFIENGYDVGNEVNDIDVARNQSSGKVFAYVMKQTSDNQLQIVDVTNVNAPLLVQEVDLPEVSGAQQYGYRVYFYKDRLYVLTRETGGPELHIFDVSNPASSLPKFSTTEMNRTVNDIVVVDQNIGGTVYTLAYVVADSDLKEIAVFDVTSGMPTEIRTVNLSGDNDAYSVHFSSANKLLYVGRQKNAGPELYAFDASDPFNALIEIANAGMGDNPLAIRVAGEFIYIATDGSNDEFFVHDANPLKNLTLIKGYQNSNKGTGIDYEDGYIYESMLQGSSMLTIYRAP